MRTKREMGVPSVLPNSVPDWIWTWSFSSRGVVMALWPGRRRLSWGWMSDSVRARPGGGLSIMQPTPLPWDSPKLGVGQYTCRSSVERRRGRGSVGTYVVTRKMEPKVDMAAAGGFQRRGAGSGGEEGIGSDVSRIADGVVCRLE